MQRFTAVVTAVGLLLLGLSVPQWVSQITGSVAEAGGTGTGGMFVPSQGRLVDTSNGTGGFSTPMVGGTYRSFQVLGQAGIPSTGVASVLINVTGVNTGAASNYINVEPDGSSSSAGSFLVQNGGETVSNTGIVAVAANGKIQVKSQQSIDIVIDVQGYFTTGNGSPAPGGFVSVAQSTIFQQASISPGSTVDVQVTGAGNVPTTATAVFANITVTNGASAVDNYLTAYPTSTTVPSTSLNYSSGKTSIGAAVDLNAQGKLSILIGSNSGATAASITVDVFGYFDGEPSNAAYNTLQTRLYDSRSPSAPLAPGEARAITVGGAGSNGTMPTTSAGLAAFAMNITASSASGSGYLTVWSPDDSEPDVTSVAYQAGLSSNLIAVKPGTSSSAQPNKIWVRNNGYQSTDVIIDAEGWFTNSQVLPAAVGAAATTSGNRSSNALLMRSLSDRVQAGTNPTNGNLLITQSLLHLSGIGGDDVNIGVRYNSLNDTRPTLNMGLFESQLFRNPDNTITYTDPSGAGFIYGPKTGAIGQYNMPNDINATLTRTVSGSPNVAISNGATYELVFHPSQLKNVYVSDGANLKLVRTEDVTGANVITYIYGTGSNGGKLTSLTDTQGRLVTFGYSNSPNPTQPTTITDTSISRSLTLAYAGPSGALSSVTNPTGAVTTWAYNGNGQVSSVTNNGTSSRADFNYGTANKISSVVYGANNTAASGTWGFAYNSATQTTVTDPRGKTNVYTINSDGRVTGTTDGRGLAGATSFSAHGEVQSQAAPGMSTTSYEYAAATEGTYNLTKITSPQASTTQFGYNPSGGVGATADYRPAFTKDAQGNYSTMTYNSWGQPLTVAVGKADSGSSTPLGGTITYTYQGSGGATCAGKNGQLCTQVDGKGNTTAFTYNAAGNLVTENLPAPLGDHTFTYDAAGRRVSETDGRGNTAYTCYDKNDRVLQVSYTSASCGTASGVTFTYDTAGNMKTRLDTSGTTTWTWDAQQRAVGKDAPGTVNDSTATYDRTGNVLTMVDGGTGAANTTTYTYDDANNLATLAEPGGSCTATPTFPNTTGCTGFVMTSGKGTRATVKFPSGVTNATTYDGSDRLATLVTKNAAGTTTFVNQTYNYGAAGSNVTVLQNITDAVTAGNTTSYGYDALNRLTTATRSAATWTYSYDKNGNRIQQNASGTVTNYGYNAADQMCWSGTGTSSSCTAPSGATTYTYDGNGNQTTTGGATYSTYNQQTGTTAGASQTYTYAGTSNDTRLTLGAVSFTNNLFNQVTAQTVGSAVTKFVREPDGTPVATQTGGVSYYYTVDYNKSVILLTNQAQAKAASYTYDPYGKATVTNTIGTVGDDNPWRYATGYQDPNTGYYKLGARYYNPTQGRFTQPDPSNEEANRYSYAANDPSSSSDPSGRCSFDPDCGNTTADSCDNFSYTGYTGCEITEDGELDLVGKIIDGITGCIAAEVIVDESGFGVAATAYGGLVGAGLAYVGSCAVGAAVKIGGGDFG